METGLLANKISILNHGFFMRVCRLNESMTYLQTGDEVTPFGIGDNGGA